MTERKPDVSHMRIFGCVAYAHVPNNLRKKLDDKSKKCIFLGYGEQSKAYLLYNPITRKVVINKDIKFTKEETWDGSVQVVGAEKIDEEVNPTHAPIEQDHEQKGPTVPKGESSSEGQALSTSTSESSAALMRR